MIQRKYESLAAVYLAIDAAASALAILAAYWLRFAVEVIPVTKGQQEISVYARILPLIVLVFPLAFAVQGLYRVLTLDRGHLLDERPRQAELSAGDRSASFLSW